MPYFFPAAHTLSSRNMLHSFIVRPVHCYNITKDNWYTTEEGIDRVLGELARCGNQFVEDLKQYLK